MKKDYPDAVILDLLLPEQHKWIARILLGRPPWYKRPIYYFLRLSLRRWAKGKIPGYLLELKEDLVTGRDPYWGGVEFVRSRIEYGDGGGIPCQPIRACFEHFGRDRTASAVRSFQ